MTTHTQVPPPILRHTGLDWLRIAAFGLLILYHIGLYFGPWGWHIDAPEPLQWLVFPLLALNPWRMTLLFVVSGYAARALLSRGEPGQFLWSRATRLLVPLAFGVLVVVAPQPWVERSASGTYHQGLLHYWLYDYFTAADHSTPTLDNLWFVVYIWAYSVIVALAAWGLPAAGQERLQRACERLLAGGRVLLLPFVWLLIVRLILFPTMQPTNRLFHDLNGHLVYFPAFLFGFFLARAPDTLADIVRLRWRAGLLALAGYAIVVVEQLLLDRHAPAGAAMALLARAGTVATNWGTIILLIGLADRFEGDSSRWRGILNEAVFPSYIVHQTAIVLIAWWIRPLGMSNLGQFALILSGTCLACLLFYWLGKASGPFRPLFGLPPRRVAAG
jgi:glucan biosynthesis protein C